MGEYARQYTLEKFGVDIGEDTDRKPLAPKPVKRFGCSCGRAFASEEARAQHQEHTGHIPSKKQGANHD